MSRIGIDVGGTFTDLVCVEGDRVVTVKVPSTPRNPAEAALRAIDDLHQRVPRPAGTIEILAHGTTVATNALLEGRGARAGFLTTRGFRDALEIGRLSRPREAIYNIQYEKPPALVPRSLRQEVTERLDYRGEVLVPLDEADVERAVRELLRQGIEAVGVCYLFSYLNPDHELRTREIIRRLAPDLYVVLSSEIYPVFREYERSSTTAIAATLGPRVTRHLVDMQGRLQRWGLERGFYIMQSNGGLTTPLVAVQNPTTLLLSGPAAGAIAAGVIGGQAGFRNIVSMDMGGTSFDVALIRDGAPFVTSDRRILDYPLHTPMIDIETIGAGGGSIAWLDPGWVMRVGPWSAGAEPGPACYGQGGREPTVTDADLLLGYLNPGYFLGGQMPLYPERAGAAIEDRLGGLRRSVPEVARGIYRIVNANMAGVTRVMCIGRGFDPREFALVAFGGAGPVHAASLARQLEIPTVIIPPHPGITSALGLLMAEIVHDYVQTFLKGLRDLRLEKLNAQLRELRDKGERALELEGVPPGRRRILLAADLRYVGQTFTLELPFESLPVTEDRLAALGQAFHDRHQAAYGFKVEEEPVEIVNLRAKAIGVLDGYRPREQGPASSGPPQAKGHRSVWFEGGAEPVRARVYDRSALGVGATLRGPAIIEQGDSTTIIPPDMACRVDAFANLVLTLEA